MKKIASVLLAATMFAVSCQKPSNDIQAPPSLHPNVARNLLQGSLSGTIAVGTFAGGKTDFSGTTNGVGSLAAFFIPYGIAVDASGNVYVADRGTSLIRKITPGRLVSTFAGSSRGYAEGTGSGAKFNMPCGIAVDANGNLFVADSGNNRIRMITPAGVVSTFAGSGTAGWKDDNGTAASFNGPNSIAIDAAGNLYVTDAGNYRIRKIKPNRDVTTIAGNGTKGFTEGGSHDVQFDVLAGIAVDAAGNVFVADAGNNRIRELAIDFDAVFTFAGNGNPAFGDGPGTIAAFNYPMGLAFDGTGNLYVGDKFNNRIRKISPSRNVTTVAGSGIISSVTMPLNAFRNSLDGFSGDAGFYFPAGIGTDANGNVYVADAGNAKVRIIESVPDGMLVSEILAGGGYTSISIFGGTSYLDGQGLSAIFSWANGITTDVNGNVYVADTWNNRIRKITPDGTVTTIAGSGTAGFKDGAALSAQFNNPTDLVLDSAGNIYVADLNNSRIRKIGIDGNVTTIAGNGTYGFKDDVGTAAQFHGPTGLAIDRQTNTLFVADPYNYRIRKITTDGTVTTLAGNGVSGYVDAQGTAAQFNAVANIAIDGNKNLYVSESNRIRKISPTGQVTTFAGNATAGYTDGNISVARFTSPRGLEVDASGNVYVVETSNLRKISPAGIVSTVTGMFNIGNNGFAFGPANISECNMPNDVAVSQSGIIYMADLGIILKLQ